MTDSQPPYPGGGSSAPSPGEQAPHHPGYPGAPYPGAPAAPPAPIPAGRSRRRLAPWIAVGLLLLTVACAVSVAVGIVAGLRDSGPGSGFGIPGGDAVAVVYLEGVITGASSGSGGFSGGVLPEDVVADLHEAEEDDSVKAIVLRIDSPGGTASASHELAEEVSRLEKPVVASVGDVAASGAYMVAARCDEIVADADSSVGSIGVIMELPDLQGLMKKLGIDVTILKQGKYKDAGSPYRKLTPEERSLIDAQMKKVYDLFIKDVAEGRELPEAKVRSYATGFVFLGSEAKEMGLIDRLGTFEDAKERAADLGGIEGDFDEVTYDEEPVFELLDLLGLSSGLRSSGLLQPGPALAR